MRVDFDLEGCISELQGIVLSELQIPESVPDGVSNSHKPDRSLRFGNLFVVEEREGGILIEGEFGKTTNAF